MEPPGPVEPLDPLEPVEPDVPLPEPECVGAAVGGREAAVDGVLLLAPVVALGIRGETGAADFEGLGSATGGTNGTTVGRSYVGDGMVEAVTVGGALGGAWVAGLLDGVGLGRLGVSDTTTGVSDVSSRKGQRKVSPSAAITAAPSSRNSTRPRRRRFSPSPSSAASESTSWSAAMS